MVDYKNLYLKALFLEWDSFGNPYLKREFAKHGIEVVLYDFPRATEDTRASESLASDIANTAINKKVDFIFSFNYFPVAAVAAAACKMKYISWTYDSPYIQLYSKTIDLPTNYAFVFDKAEYYNLKAKGIETVYYLPMAGAVQDYDEIILTADEHKKYDADIAMVGSMYTEEKHRTFRHFDKVDEYTKGFVDAIINAQKGIFGASIIEASLNKDIVKRIQKSCPIVARGDGYESEEWVLANYFIARELTARERREYLTALAEENQVVVYTSGDTSRMPAIVNRGTLDYYAEAPKAMKAAKINLNIALRSIVTGIPLRCFDIMAAGGFLLTSYQQDMLEFFEADKDFVYYDSLADLKEKAAYYLEHDDIRQEIAKSGYEKVKKYHNYEERVAQMLKIVFE